MPKDIRDRLRLTHDDIVGLNFIRQSGPYIYRRHYRAGLRSHVMEVLKSEDLLKEQRGVERDGVKWFPRAKPVRMLRIFRTRFPSLKEAGEEMDRVKVVARYLGPEKMAMSEEFLVEYREDAISDFLLCGLQEYVEGEVIDPWGYLGRASLISLLRRMAGRQAGSAEREEGLWVEMLTEKVDSFIEAVRQMITEAGYVPDLAGVGNLLVTISGHIRLVDINNISRVSFGSGVYLDDKGYPVCDKSIQALALLKEKLVGKKADGTDAVFKRFLDPARINDVSFFEKEFHRSAVYGSSYPRLASPVW